MGKKLGLIVDLILDLIFFASIAGMEVFTLVFENRKLAGCFTILATATFIAKLIELYPNRKIEIRAGAAGGGR